MSRASTINSPSSRHTRTSLSPFPKQGGGFPTSKGAGGGVFPTSKSSGGGVNGALAPHAPNGTTHQHHQAHSVYAAKKHLKPCDLPSFELGRVLGTGSFGRVSFARHRSTGTLVAIKVLSKAEVRDGTFGAFCRRQSQTHSFGDNHNDTYTPDALKAPPHVLEY